MLVKIKLLILLCICSSLTFAAKYTPDIELPNISISTSEPVEIANWAYDDLSKINKLNKTDRTAKIDNIEVDLSEYYKTKGSLKIENVELDLPISKQDISHFHQMVMKLL